MIEVVQSDMTELGRRELEILKKRDEVASLRMRSMARLAESLASRFPCILAETFISETKRTPPKEARTTDPRVTATKSSTNVWPFCAEGGLAVVKLALVIAK
jgi:hypothetical protein